MRIAHLDAGPGRLDLIVKWAIHHGMTLIRVVPFARQKLHVSSVDVEGMVIPHQAKRQLQGLPVDFTERPQAALLY